MTKFFYVVTKIEAQFLKNRQLAVKLVSNHLIHTLKSAIITP